MIGFGDNTRTQLEVFHLLFNQTHLVRQPIVQLTENRSVNKFYQFENFRHLHKSLKLDHRSTRADVIILWEMIGLIEMYLYLMAKIVWVVERINFLAPLV